MIGTSPRVEAAIREPLTLINNWKVYGDATYGWVEVMMDAQGTCALTGLVAGGTMGTTVAMIPPSYRPTYHELFAAVSYGAGAYQSGSLFILSTGVLVANTGGTDFLSLNQVMWKVGSG